MNPRISDIPQQDRPREKLLRKGAAALSDRELLAVLLGSGTPGVDVMQLAGELARVIDAKGLEVQVEDLTAHEGVGDAKASRILAALEFALRRIKPEGVKSRLRPTSFRRSGITPTALSALNSSTTSSQPQRLLQLPGAWPPVRIADMITKHRNHHAHYGYDAIRQLPRKHGNGSAGCSEPPTSNTNGPRRWIDGRP